MQISRIKQLGSRYIDRHWLLVHKTVEEIFKGEILRVDEFRNIIKEWPQKAQLVVYHNEPFNTAADICGVRSAQIKKKQVVQYRILCRNIYTEEALKFLKSRKGPIKISWLMRMVFGSHHDLGVPNAAITDLENAGRIIRLSGDRVKYLK